MRQALVTQVGRTDERGEVRNLASEAAENNAFFR